MQAIHLLDQNKKGKANFFILDNLNDVRLKEVSVPADAVVALGEIEVDEPYTKLAAYLLSNVFITSDEYAEADGDAVLVHKNGKFVRGNYTLSGGSVGLFEGKENWQG